MYKVYSCKSVPDQEKSSEAAHIPPLNRPNFAALSSNTQLQQPLSLAPILLSMTALSRRLLQQKVSALKNVHFTSSMHACRLTGSGQPTVTFLVHGQVTERPIGKQSMSRQQVTTRSRFSRDPTSRTSRTSLMLRASRALFGSEIAAAEADIARMLDVRSLEMSMMVGLVY